MRRFVSAFLSALVALALATACARQPNDSAQGGKKYTLAVIPKGTTHGFWESIHAGAVKAARELTAEGTQVDLIWKGPMREDDREQQIQVVEGFISQRVDGIVLAPLDRNALVRPVEEGARAGVPTVVIDSGLESNNIVSFVATDNLQGGMLAADHMGELLEGRGRVLLLRYQEGSASTQEREEGFVRRLKERYPGIELISSEQYAGPTRDTAKTAAENLLNRHGDSLQGIFTVNESSTAGMLLALQDIGRAGKVSFIGFDASEQFVNAMRAKELHGIVVQNPMKMGYLGVRTMVDHLRGRPVEKRIDTGVVIITPENLDQAESRELLDPPIEEYLR